MSLLTLIKDLTDYSDGLDLHIGQNQLKISLKKKFLVLWNEVGTGKIVRDQVRIANGAKAPTYAVTEELLLKCAKAVSLYNEYDRLRELLKNNIENVILLNKIGAEKDELTTAERAALEKFLDGEASLAEDLESLKLMLASKKDRKKDGHVGPFKQITRAQGDQWGSALATFIGTLAADAYPNKVTLLLQKHAALANDICSYDDTAPLKLEEVIDRKLQFSILTKPFTILTGGSGTGKTKLAESIAGHFRNHDDMAKATNIAIVPVGADWTDNRNVLGFVNHLRPDGDPVFQTTPVLDLLLEASDDDNAAAPFFLILDEMNLSHVERYFADFLSVMEQQNGAFQLHSEGPREDFEYVLPRYEGDETGVPRILKYPENLFVIGTVNVDETTYMFSPKVLDRANVIEFSVTADEIDSFLQEPKEYPEVEKAAHGVAQGFQKLALSARNGELDDLPDAVALNVRTQLVDLFELLKRGRFEFAYRTSNEVIRYMKVCRHLADDKDEWDGGAWLNDLDDQIVQKILPKLHGSMGRVGRLLGALATYTAGKSRENSMAWFPAEGASPPLLQNALKDVEERDHPEFPDSRKKLCSMIEVLLDEQFVSFIN